MEHVPGADRGQVQWKGTASARAQERLARRASVDKSPKGNHHSMTDRQDNYLPMKGHPVLTGGFCRLSELVIAHRLGHK